MDFARPRKVVVSVYLAAFLAAFMVAGAALAHTAIPIASDSSGRLKAIYPDFQHTLPVSLFPEAPGWASGALGFESLFGDYPDLDLFAPSPGADIEVVLVSFDAGCRVWAPTAPLEAGQTLHLGTPFFDYHPLWQIPDGPPGDEFTLTFIARDRNGIHTDSEPFVVHLTAEYCRADFDRSGYVNGDDFDSFVILFEAGDPGADFNGDEFVNGIDFDEFIAAFESGC